MLFSNNIQFDFSFYLAVETCGSLSLAQFFNGLNCDDAFVHCDTLSFQSLCDLSCSNCTEDLTVFVSLNYYLQSQSLELSCQSLSVSQLLSQLLSLLFEVLSQLFAVAVVSNNSEFVRNELVTSVTVLNLNDIVLVA